MNWWAVLVLVCGALAIGLTLFAFQAAKIAKSEQDDHRPDGGG